MKIHLLRHATLSIDIKDHKILLDPMLSPSGAWDSIPETPNPSRNPLVDLPITNGALESLIQDTHLFLITHTHFDHWDDVAIERLPKTTPLFCQPPDLPKVRKDGFKKVRAIEARVEWKGIQITRTEGKHGSGELAERMGPVSGFHIKIAGEPSLYIAGDTVWCPEVESAILEHHPKVIVVNAGAAQFNEGGPITMTADDVLAVCAAAPEAKVIAVHMGAVNHCVLTRESLEKRVEGAGRGSRVMVARDGEELVF